MSDRNLVFKPMCSEDLPWVAGEEKKLYPFPWSRQNFADSLSAGYSSWLMWQAQVPIGYAVLMLVMDEAHLLNLSVIQPLQRQGYGSLLLEHLNGVSRRAGAAQMFLEVRPSNLPALGMYRKRGFAVISVRRGYYPSTDGREDAIVMRCAL